MPAGDTISGQVRVQRRTVDGNEFVVAGPYSQTEADQATFENRLFHNVTPGRDAPPGGANIRSAPSAKFLPGEVLAVQHLSAILAEAIDVGDDEYQIGILRKDLNTGVVRPGTLTVTDSGTTVDPTSSTTVWTTFFTYTVPDRQIVGLKGQFFAAATETV